LEEDRRRMSPEPSRDRARAGGGLPGARDRSGLARAMDALSRLSCGGVEVVSDPTALTIAEAGEWLRAKRLSASELAAAYLARIERVNPLLNAYVTVTAERALADARRATEEIARGDHRGPLHGIPIGLKDLVDTAGIRTTYGSKVHATHVPSADAMVAQKLARAGAVLLGKHNTHEYAFGVTTDN